MSTGATEVASGHERVARWAPAPRPEWVTQINAQGENLDLASVVSLRPEELIATACTNTGLEDFGEDSWHAPFVALANDLDHQAHLNLVGRLLARQDLVIMLEARLQVEATYAAHPEIEEEGIVQPLLVIGQGRSGTSILQGMLAAHPDNGTLTHWEAMFPCPPPESATYQTDPRIERADKLLSVWNNIAPEVEAMREFAALEPAETVHLQTLSFNSPAYFCSVVGQALNYAQFVTTEYDVTGAYRYEKRVMKLLQWRNPRKRWVMKSPAIINHLREVLEVYPDASFVWTHRDPIKALASIVSLIGTLHWMRSDSPFIHGSMAQYTTTEGVAAMLNRPITWLQDGSVPPERLCNVRYSDFVDDPLAVAAQIYRYFDLELTADGRAAMARYMDEHRRDARPAHAYEYGSSEEISLSRQAFHDYQDYFDVPSEL